MAFLGYLAYWAIGDMFRTEKGVLATVDSRRGKVAQRKGNVEVEDSFRNVTDCGLVEQWDELHGSSTRKSPLARPVPPSLLNAFVIVAKHT